MENNIEQQLEVIVKENSIAISPEGKAIIDAFGGYFKQAKSFEDLSKTLVVNDVSQVAEMAKAKEARRVLKQCRLNTENARKEFKQGYLNKGRAVDMIAKLVSSTIEPLETYFENQEKFAENIEKAKIKEMIVARETSLKQYVEDISVYNVVVMTDEAFNVLLADLKANWDKKQAELKKIEDERIAKELAEKAEAEKNKLEVERLKKEAEIKEKELAEERAKAEKEKKEREEAIAKEKAEAERIAKLEREENEAKLKKEAEAREKVEAELKAKKDEEIRIAKEKEEKIQAEKLAKLEAEKQAKLAPEKDKLNIYANMIKSIIAPQDLSKAGQAIIAEAEKGLLEISQKIKEQIKNL